MPKFSLSNGGAASLGSDWGAPRAWLVIGLSVAAREGCPQSPPQASDRASNELLRVHDVKARCFAPP
jgi:hypothetical protein